MKKRIIVLLVAVILCLGSIPALADNSSEEFQIIAFSDGSYLIMELIGDSIETQLDYNRTSVTKSKAATYYSNSGVKAFTLTVTGSFIYDGTSATCTSSSNSSTIYNNEWSLKTASASHSGNTATATGTFVRKVLGIVVSTKVLTVSLSCSPTGVFS